MWHCSSWLNRRDTGDRPFLLEAVWTSLPATPNSTLCIHSVRAPAAGEEWLVTPTAVSLAGSLCSLMQTSPHHLFFYLFHSQEALTVFKEAIQKMPRQFAPQSLYNMMGKSCFCFKTWRTRFVVLKCRKNNRQWNRRLRVIFEALIDGYASWIFVLLCSSGSLKTNNLCVSSGQAAS